MICKEKSWILVLCCMVLCIEPAFAGTTGQLCGQMVDEQGSPLPGVSVSAESPSQIGGVQLAETDVNGWFRYPRLAPGYYTVRIELDGFVTQELTEVQVRLDHMTELQVTLPLARFGDEVVVTETTPVVDPAQVSTGQTFTSEYLQEAAVGMENRHYLEVLPQAAGVKQEFASVSVLGSTGVDNTFLVDGSDTTDPYDKRVGLWTLSLEAIDEIAFHTAGFEAEYGRATGGVVNLITKSGGNRFAGSFDFRYSDSGFSSSGDHHDPDEEPFETRDLNASLGGPIFRDRAWFFGAVQSFQRQKTPAGAPSTSVWDEQNYLGKLTWQASSSWSIVGRVIGNPVDERHANTSPFRAPEAEADLAWRGINAHMELNGVLSDRLLYGLRASAQEASSDFLPSDGDLTTIGHRNLYTGEHYGNYESQDYDVRERREIETDLTWFVTDLAGSHEVKAGIGYGNTGYSDNWCNNGSGRVCTAGVEGYLFRDLTDEAGSYIPFRFTVREAAGPQEFSGSLQTVYVQDAWRIRPDLTLKLGLRWDGSQQENDVGQEIADFAMLQPRLGLAWDIRGNGRNILRASWGQYMHPSKLVVAYFVAATHTPAEIWLSCSYLGLTDPGLCAEVAATDGLDYRLDPEGWDPAGWLEWFLWFSEPAQTSADLEPLYANELVLAFERELYRRTSLELSYVKKDTKSLMEDTCNGNLPTPQPDADCDHFVLANLPGMRSDYEALMLRLESRALDRLHLIGSYVYSDWKDSRTWGGEVDSAFDVFPYHFVNRYGYVRDHSRHRLKLNGFVILPLDFSLALNSWWNSEFRWTPLTGLPPVPWGVMYLEPRGNRSEPGEYQIDLQLGKGFTWGRTRLRLFGTVYNVLSSESATDVCTNETGCGAFELGDPIAWQLPRRYELGVRVEF